MKWPALSNLVWVLLLGAGLPIALSLAFSIALPEWKWVQAPLHSTMESLGVIGGISVGVLLLVLRKRDPGASHYLWVSCALISMGVFDGIHAAVPHGNTFVWLHSMAALSGGIFLSLVWLPSGIAESKAARALPMVAAALATVLGTLSMAFPDLVPAMLEGNQFTAFASVMNSIGAALFFSASAFFLVRYHSHHDSSSPVFAYFCILNGSAGFMFFYSSAWDAEWWLWHISRGASYLILAAYMLVIFRQSETSVRDLDLARAELAERERSEEKLKLGATMLDNATDSITLHDLEGRIIYGNETAHRHHGCSSGELAGMIVTQFLSAEAAKSFYPNLKYLIEKREAMFEVDIVRVDGLTLPMEIHSKIVEVAGQKRVLTVGRDISERRRMEIEWKKQSKMVGNITRGITDSILIISADFKILWANRGAMEKHGYSSVEEMVGTCCYTATHHRDTPCDSSREQCPVVELKRRGKPVTVEHVHFDKAGKESFVEVAAYPINDENGEMAEFVHVCRDVTEHKRLEERFLQAQKMESVGRLAGGVAHDFNNMLTGIIGFSELAMATMGPDDPLKFYFQEIKKQGARAAELTRKLLAVSRKQVLERRNVDLNRLINDTEKFLTRVIGEDINLEVIIELMVHTIYVDPGQIEQVLLNLCTNARDAMPGGGKLTIRTRNVSFDGAYCRLHDDCEPGDYVEVSVTDTGTGMTAEVKKHLSEPFFTTKERGKGTGLGLATVYGIVKQHGGLIEVQSEPGSGTTFSICFKAVSAEADPVEKAEIGIVPGGKETVLIADDEPVVREMAARTLSGYGYTVLRASDGEEALRVFEANRGRVNILLLDVVMPGLGGLEVYTRLRAKEPDVKFLLMSGYSPELLKDIIEAGLDFLAKPFSPVALARRVREVLDR